MLFLFYLGLFIAFNGKFTWEIFYIGLPVAAGMDYFSIRHLGYSPKKMWRVFKKIPGIIKYLIILLIEIIKANVAVIKMIFSFDIEPEPCLKSFDSGLSTKTGNALLANSITLTPGTITVEMEDGNFLVHALDKEYAEGIEESIFVKEIKKLEKEGKK